MPTKSAPSDNSAAARKHRQRQRELAAGFKRVLLKVPAEQVEHFKELAAAARALKEQPGHQPAE